MIKIVLVLVACALAAFGLDEMELLPMPNLVPQALFAVAMLVALFSIMNEPDAKRL